MKHLLLIATILAPLPAYAIGGYDQAPISIQQEQQAAAAASAHAYGGQAKATSYGSQQHQNAYGGQATGGSAKAAGGRGGAGGSVTVNNQYSGGDPAPAAADPSGYSGTRVVAPPSIANVLQPAAGDDCPGVGLGAGGSGPTGAGILSYTWEGPHCTARRDAKLLIEMGHPLAAEYVLSQANDEVRKGLEWEARYAPQLPAQPARDPNFLGDFCAAVPQACDGSE